VDGAVKAGACQIKSCGTGAQNIAAVALPLGLQLEHLVTEGRTTVGDLEAIKGPFQDAVKKSKACQALKPSDDEQRPPPPSGALSAVLTG
jgi:hypothetical protein